jgi:hypothetical protein
MARCQPGLFQALIQVASGSPKGFDCSTLVILLGQHLSLNEQLGGGPTNDSCISECCSQPQPPIA